MELFDLRKEYGLSQLKAAEICGVPLRTYIRYERDDNYGSNLKRSAMISIINRVCEITEEKGVLTINRIIEVVHDLITKKYCDSVTLCYLFGSYAKGYATEKSDVDLLVSTNLQGLDYVGLAEDIHQALHKNVDLNNFNNSSSELLYEVMKDGIKIYG